jgi:putative ABC transport system permease protein
LGVIAARSVVERRQQIGVLRAIGFQKGMVRNSFLLESSFIALLGIGIGLVLGFALSPQIINTMAEEFVGLKTIVPWQTILIVTLVAYASAVLTTILPAREASAVTPAEALRYE